ncbi:MAG: hypothetical protein KY476_10540 [Planctomycetes bacterium]|nr:hypothetical protein [Planctomycetota bacterium]
MTDISALDRLAALVRHAELTAKSEQLETEMEESARCLREAQARNEAARKRIQDVRVRRMAELDAIEDQRQQLEELVRKSARYKLHLTSAQEAEELITRSRDEIEGRAREAREEIDAAETEARESLEALRAAMERYEKVRSELDDLEPQMAGQFTTEDEIFQQAAVFFPSGELRALEKEVRECDAWYGTMERNEQFAQMKIWIGRLRRLQALEITEDEQVRARRLFPQLVGISKHYEPGYIEAFQQDYNADWERFIAEAEKELETVRELNQRRRELRRQQREQAEREEADRLKARESAQGDLEDLKRAIASFNLPDEGQDEFRSAVKRVMAGFGASDEEVLRLVAPYKDLLEGSEFRALRRSLERVEQGNGEEEPLGETIADILSETRGRKGVIVGGSRREDVRQQLEELFEFAKLEWEDYEGNKPVKLKAMEQRVKNGGLDMMLMLKSFISHHVSDKLRPLCEQHGIPCLMVEHGYGAAQIAATMRRHLLPQP